METDKALAVLDSQANGIDPSTGMSFELACPRQSPDVIRALFIAIKEVTKTLKPSKRSSRPNNAGKPWTAEDDQLLLDRYGRGSGIAALARLLERTPASIQARPERHGRIQGFGLQWHGRQGPIVTQTPAGSTNEADQPSQQSKGGD